MIVSVVRAHNWAPDIMGALFVDGQDYEGLEFWYDEVKQAMEETTKKK
jgi:hypothetical protein